MSLTYGAYGVKVSRKILCTRRASIRRYHGNVLGKRCVTRHATVPCDQCNLRPSVIDQRVKEIRCKKAARAPAERDQRRRIRGFQLPLDFTIERTPGEKQPGVIDGEE